LNDILHEKVEENEQGYLQNKVARWKNLMIGLPGSLWE
jgi:hypothetical protein